MADSHGILPPLIQRDINADDTSGDDDVDAVGLMMLPLIVSSGLEALFLPVSVE